MAGQQGEKKDEMVVSLKTTGKTHVKPRKKPEGSECRLFTSDLPSLAFYYNQKLMFYKGGDFEGKVAKLKGGLEQVLVEFYQLAGKLGKDEEGVFRVEYEHEKAAGVEVVEAAVEAVAVKDLAAEEGTSIFKDLIPYNGVHSLDELHRPLLAIQLTKLKDGLAIGCAFNHAVVDETSTWSFMGKWAQKCRDSPAVSAPPFLDRTVGPEVPDPSSALSSGGDPTRLLRERVFRFSQGSMDKIKLAIKPGASSDCKRGFSLVEALSVHIWRHVTKARGLKEEDGTVFTKLAECRNWNDPSCFGNLTRAISTRPIEARLLEEKPPKCCAGIIQEAIEEQKKQWESQPKIFPLKDPKAIEERNEQGKSQPKDAGKNCVTIEGSPHWFKVYEVDFGWGSPEGVRSGSNNRFDGMAYLYQGKSDRTSIDVEITLEDGVMKKLEEDLEFLKPQVTKFGDKRRQK